ncbi:MAG: hypothetical protein V2I24_09320 [Halieaceae bacterium]|nr:hypothetical protein [Halieaceae bacterium]
MLGVLTAPVLLTFILNWQQQESESIKQLAISSAKLATAFERFEGEMRERVSVVEAAQRAISLAEYSRQEADNAHQALESRMARLVLKIEKNTDHVTELTEKLDRLCDSLPECPQ